ncbi:carbohydrate kinase family protein [Ochrovirga pacifica]|uniref:carbohydrate kinase family protein n=1 Tax=Ochrovirga pacifica TaxID=1042376 RepID=UPI0002557BA6|nr:carbohydrate kinase [Ochrovirga pacifica]
MKNIVCFGEVLWDVFPDEKKIGGAPLNVAVRLQSLGNNVSIISSVGNDLDGKNILDFVAKAQVNSQEIQTHLSEQTGSVTVNLDTEGSASYEIDHPRAWDKIQLTEGNQQMVKRADAFVYGSLSARDQVSKNTLTTLLQLAPYKIFDVNLRKPYYSFALLNKLMQEADFIKFNDDEILEIAAYYKTTNNSIEEAIDCIVKETNTATICVTQGSKGAVLYSDGKLYSNSGYAITVVDTVGAGDSFLATLVDQLLKETDPQNAIDLACAMGALVASHKGATPKINQQEIDALMQS